MSLNSLHQEIADNFYPERADFTVTRYLGTEFAANLTTSYPILVRRELGSLISGMIRPNEMDWFSASIFREDKLDKPGKSWLEAATKTQTRAMYDRPANLTRSAKETDNDFVTFGNGVLHLQHNAKKNTLLYLNRHLRDCVWCENDEGQVDLFHRKWVGSARNVVSSLQGKEGVKIHPKLMEKANGKEKYENVNIRHIMIPSEDYDTGSGPDGKRYRTPFVSVWVDIDNEEILLEEASLIFQYIVPRWQTVSGNQYGFSPCTVAGLPDARLIQQMMLTFLEAGQKAVNPPMVATNDVIKSGVNLYEGGITWVDKEYDERAGASLRILEHDYSGIPVGEKIQEFIREQLKEAFYLNKINMPPAVDSKQMTAFEVGQRVQEYVRNALPLFEPMEMDYNGAMCDMTFELLMAHGAFGSRFDMPQSLRGQDVRFKFKSTLHDTKEKQRGPTFAQASAMIAQAMSLDPAAGKIVKLVPSIKWALEGMAYPQDLVNSDQDIAKAVADSQKQQQQAGQLAAMQQGGAAAQSIGAAAESFKNVMPQ